MTLLKNGAVVEDPWVYQAGGTVVAADAPVIVSLEDWREQGDALRQRNTPLGIRLQSDQPPSLIADDLGLFGVVALEFPQFKDGRGFSYARSLRQRHKYHGEIRATGSILRDQFMFLDRCGIDALEVEDEAAAKDWLEAMAEFSVWMQPAADARKTALQRRQGTSGQTGGLRRFESTPAVPDPEAGKVASAAARVRSFSQTYGHLSAQTLLAAMIKTEFPGRIALVSSFGTEAAILLRMVANVDPDTPVIFLETGKLFGETMAYRDTLIKRLGLTDVRSVHPDSGRLAELDPLGDLWTKDPDLCCQIRKVEPLGPALDGFDTWITGRKRYQGQRRAVLPVIEASAGRIKINPVASWSRDVIDDYFRENELPRHPLESDGYLSVGCMPCTDRARPGEGARAGRWRGRDKDECGIHETPAGQSLTSSEL